VKIRFIFFLTLIFFCIFSAVSGCTESNDRNSGGLNESLKEESQQIAGNYVRDLDSYKTYNLTEPVLTESTNLNCSSCWQFVYKFDLVSEKDPDVVDTATVTVTVTEGEVVDTSYAQGSRYKLGIPSGSMGADDLLEKPVYDTEVFVYGTVSELEASEPDNVEKVSFKLNWENAELPVMSTGKPTGIEDIENGDWIIVTGELKTGNETGRDKGPVLFASRVQTEDLAETGLFTSEVNVNEEEMIVREIPANETAQAYRVWYEIREDGTTLEAKEKIFQNISPDNPIEIEIRDVKTGSTYTIRVFIRNMEGRILYDTEHVGGFGVEEKKTK
jgi:hypothetical protein